MTEKVTKSDKGWRQILTLEQYEITQKKGTEPPFTGNYCDFRAKHWDGNRYEPGHE